MQYLCLIYDAESNRAAFTPEQATENIAEYKDFTERLTAAGNFVGGDALTPVDTATTIRVRDGKVLQTDGPFAETKEQLGGYYLINAENLDEAVKWAAQIPTAKSGSIEVRPIMVWDAPADG